MGTAIIFVIALVCLIGVGMLTVFLMVRSKWRKLFPSAKQRDKIKLLDKGLEVAGFYEKHDDKDNIKVIDNDYLSSLISDLHETEDLDLYVEVKGLRISNNSNRKLKYGWILSNEYNAIGFDIKR